MLCEVNFYTQIYNIIFWWISKLQTKTLLTLLQQFTPKCTIPCTYRRFQFRT